MPKNIAFYHPLIRGIDERLFIKPRLCCQACLAFFLCGVAFAQNLLPESRFCSFISSVPACAIDSNVGARTDVYSQAANTPPFSADADASLANQSSYKANELADHILILQRNRLPLAEAVVSKLLRHTKTKISTGLWDSQTRS